MIKKANNLRKIYLAYWIIIGELFCGALVFCAEFITDQPLQWIIRVIGFCGIVIVPVSAFILFRWLRRDNENSSDELERMILQKAFAVTGFCALTSAPVLLLLVILLSNASAIIAFGYMALVAGTFKISTLYYHRKY